MPHVRGRSRRGRAPAAAGHPVPLRAPRRPRSPPLRRLRTPPRSRISGGKRGSAPRPRGTRRVRAGGSSPRWHGPTRQRKTAPPLLPECNPLRRALVDPALSQVPGAVARVAFDVRTREEVVAFLDDRLAFGGGLDLLADDVHPGEIQYRVGVSAVRLDLLGADGIKELRAVGPGCADPLGGRSEEHTSELQSRGHLVCRLLLEKKKTHVTSQ